MIAEHLKELHWTGLVALVIGIVAHRLTGSSRPLAEPRRAAGAVPLVRAAGRVVRRHAGAFSQLIGRLLAAAIFG